MNYDEKTKQSVLRENTSSGITKDTYVWRICQTKYLELDLKNDQNTLVMPCFDTQNDLLENPLRDALMNLDSQKYQLFNDMMSTYYTQCWSLRSDIDWSYFGATEDVVRIKCKASVLFDRLVNISDKYYSLHYHMGLIEYKNKINITNSFKSGDFESFLDSNGTALVESIMTLHDQWTDEQEVRLLYVYQPQADNLFPTTHSIHGNIKQYCSHVFDWQNAIEEYEFCPKNNNDNVCLERWLAAYGASKKS
jgi:hypothetical protein